ncbi:MAG: DUF1853 family protein [Flavobacteriales bacterium]|nr:DUF1853 family protein [Flavobacteriales bacterium]
MAIAQERIMKYKQTIVRELAWLIGSAPLMLEHGYKGDYKTLDQAWFDALFESSLDLFESWDADLDLMTDLREKLSGRLLGKRFEGFLEFFFDQHPRFRIEASGFQLAGNGRTVGEIDFIVRDLAVDEVFHLEVACKFYLSFKNSPSWNLWVGPNGKDRLDIKMNKLSVQLARLGTPEGKTALEQMNLSAPLPVLLMKGGFFHHLEKIRVAKRPKFSNPGYESGWWIKLRELNQLLQNRGKWIALQKDAWMCPQRFESDENLLRSDQLEAYLVDHFTRHKHAVVLAQLIESSQGWDEVSRGFVVRNSWPD